MNDTCKKLNKEFKENNTESISLAYPEISGLTPHIFKHNYATDLYYADVPIRETIQLMGYSTISAVTQKNYTHLEKNKMLQINMNNTY